MSASPGCAPGFIRNRNKQKNELKRQKERNVQIDKEMEEYCQQQMNIVKLLLLGSGESGKSTVLKQMKLLHGKITDDDYVKVKPIIYSNVLTSMSNILLNMESLGIVFENPKCQEDKELVLDLVYHNEVMITRFAADVFTSLVVLWSDEGVQECYNRRNEYQLADYAKYFLDKLRDLYADDYIPSTQDLLYARTMTKNIVHFSLFLENIELKVIDVGGQITERRKWIHYFDEVDSVLFVAAVSDFNLMMREDITSNRLLDSISLFDHIIGLSYFEHTYIILFFNKIDLFREKIQSKVSIKTLFKDYEGNDTYEESLQYIENKFIGNHEKREIYPHQTCATDSNQVQIVLKSCEELIISRNVKQTFCA